MVITLPIYCDPFKVTKEGQPLGYEGGENIVLQNLVSHLLIRHGFVLFNLFFFKVPVIKSGGLNDIIKKICRLGGIGRHARFRI